MSGIAAALAYGGRLSDAAIGARGLWAGVRPLWWRAWTLYLVHLALTVWAMAILAGAARLHALPELASRNNLRALFADPLGTLAGIPLMTHQLGYVNILPVYIVLLIVAPLLIRLGQRAPARLALGSALLWFVAGLLRLNFPNFPNPGGWFFNPFAWQAVFVVGLLVGLALGRGERLVPVRAGGLALAAGFLLLALLWREVPPVGTWFDEQLWRLGRLGVPFHLVGHDKTFLALPRLLHVLALLYVLSALPAVRRLAEARASAWLRLLGRRGLLVFATGTVLAIAAQASLAVLPGDARLILGVVPLGIAVQLAVAWLAERAAAPDASARPDAGSAEAVREPLQQPLRLLPPDAPVRHALPVDEP